MVMLLQRYAAQIGALIGITVAFAFVRYVPAPLWLAVPIGILLVYISIFLTGLAIGSLRR